MKPKNPRYLSSLTHFRLRSPALGLAVAVSSLAVQSVYADATWVGDTSQDWNNAANWSSDPAAPTGNFTVNTATAGVYPIISANSVFTPVDVFIGTGAGQVGQLDQTAGTASTGAGNWMIIGRDGGTGTFNLSGGTFTAADIHMARATGVAVTATVNVGPGTINTTGAFVVSDGQNNVTTAQGTVNVNSGGTLNSENDLLFSFAGDSSTFGEINIAAGATVNVATTTERWVIMSVWDASQGRLNVNGGTLNLNANTDMRFSTGSWGPGASVGASFITLNSGAITGGAGSVIDLNQNGDGAINNTVNLNGGTLTIGQIISSKANGSRVVNFNGGTLKAAGNNTNFLATGAASAANVKAGGAIIDSNGFDVTIGRALVADSSSGGLTKIGAGTLTLAGANTYTGNTTVNAGQLTLADNSTVKFVVGAVGVNNQITGTGTVLLDGDFTIDTTGAGTTIGDSWTLVNVGTLTETFGANFTVAGWAEVSSGIWQSPAAPFYRFTETTGVLQAVENSDSDSDGLPDLWEDHYFGDDDGIVESTDLTPQSGGSDADSDGFDNAAEFAANTAPNNAAFTPADTDGDGLADLWEDQYFGDNDTIVESTDLTPQNGSGDPDGDLATNLMEFGDSSDPLIASSWPDTDSDSMNDGWETAFFTNLAKDGSADTDLDGFTDLEEHDAHTNPIVTGVSPIWAALKHRWSFNGNLIDTVGSSNATIVPVGTSANGVTQNPTSITMTGGDRANSDYVKLGENLLPKSTTPVTIELWAKQNSIKNWSRIFDFHSSTSEYLMMAWTMNSDNATDRLEFHDGPTALYMDNANQPYGITDEHHIVVTLEPLAGNNGTTRVSIYSALTGATDLGPAKAVAETNVNLVNFNDALDALGYSPWPDDTANATYNEVRIWNGALLGWMREKLHDQGADNAAIPDTDGDRLPDDWEIQYFTNTTTATALSGNNDGDEYTNLEEYVAGSNPNNNLSTPEDIDGDGLLDSWEIQYFNDLDEIGSGDPDQDGLTNEQEETADSDPTDDEDGLLAAWEVFFFGSTTTQSGDDDSDGDGFTNDEEENLSQPNNAASTPDDVNGDGIDDTAQHTLAFEDVLGTTSFNAAQNWNDNLPPAAGETYIVPVASLRTPAGVGDFTFVGARLDFIEIYTGKPTLVVKNDGVTTIPFLTLNGSRINHASTNSFVNTLAGTIDIRGPLASEISANNGPFIVNAVISGSTRLDLTGGGSVTFAGANTHTGSINSTGGGLILSSSGTLKFVPGASGVNNAITGTSAATLNGTFNIDTSGASTASGSTWDLITTSGAVTIGANFTVSGFTADAGAVGARIWTSGSYQYDEATGVLSVSGADPDTDDDGMEDAWETTYGLSVGTDDSLDDLDGDNTDNLTEYRLGLVPNSGTSRFAVTRNATSGLLTWPSMEGVTFRIERSTTLGTWTVLDGAYPAAASPATTTTYTDGSAPAGKAFYRVGLNP